MRNQIKIWFGWALSTPHRVFVNNVERVSERTKANRTQFETRMTQSKCHQTASGAVSVCCSDNWSLRTLLKGYLIWRPRSKVERDFKSANKRSPPLVDISRWLTKIAHRRLEPSQSRREKKSHPNRSEANRNKSFYIIWLKGGSRAVRARMDLRISGSLLTRVFDPTKRIWDPHCISWWFLGGIAADPKVCFTGFAEGQTGRCRIRLWAVSSFKPRQTMMDVWRHKVTSHAISHIFFPSFIRFRRRGAMCWLPFKFLNGRIGEQFEWCAVLARGKPPAHLLSSFIDRVKS